MTVNDTIAVLSILKAAYPRFYADLKKDGANSIINLWSTMFAEDDVEDVKLALHKLISTNEFPPTIAELRQALAETSREQIPDAGEAWGEVQRAIRGYGYMRGDEALKSLSELTRKAVQSMGWLNLCQSEDSMADRAHFLKIYASFEYREKEKRQIPAGMQAYIAKRIALNAPKEEPLMLEAATEEPEPGLVSIQEHFKALKTVMGIGGQGD